MDTKEMVDKIKIIHCFANGYECDSEEVKNISILLSNDSIAFNIIKQILIQQNKIEN